MKKEIAAGRRTIVRDGASLTPGTLIDGARMYAAAADSVNDDYPNALHVLSHLIGMSIELALKAFLRHAGYKEQQLRDLGHNLAELLSKAETAGLTETGSRHFRLSVLGANYEERLFAYPQAAMLNVILPSGLRASANGIIQEVFLAIHGEAKLQELEDAPGLSIKSTYPDDIDAGAWATQPVKSAQ
jgi:hypothetical protein